LGTHRAIRRARTLFDRILRITTSVALITASTTIPVAVSPSPAMAAPATLSVSASVSSRPLLGGQATVHVTVRNTDTTDKAYNISLSDVLSSSRVDPQGVATFVSASDGNGALVPTSVSTTATTGDTTVSFVNIRDLAPLETYEMDIVVDLAGDATWEAGDLLNNAVTAYGNTIPNQTIPDISTSTSASARVLPIIIRSKNAHQSTGVEQATGTGARAFYYTIDLQNNYTGPSQSVVVTDTIPDGIEYLGPHGASPAPDSVSRDASTGVTTLVWDLGTIATSGSRQLAYDAGIRYDYFGTNNGGVNRDDASALTSASAGQPIITDSSAKKTFTNTANLGASWLSNPATDTAHANVTGAALTVAKGADKTSGGLGTVINYTLTYATSEYYSTLATGALTPIHDHLPDGQVFDTMTAVPAPDSIQHNSDGSTDVTWTVGAVANTSGGTISFAAHVATNWEDPGYAGDPIVSGDSMVNNVDISGVASDNVDPVRPEVLTTSADSVGFSTHLPSINKYMLDPGTSTWSKDVTMTVGDTSTVRVRFNTTNGSTPERSDINMGNIELTDWLPAGMSIVDGTFNATYSDAGDFTLPTTGTPPPLSISTPTTTSIGGVQGVSWYLGNVAPAGWWEATFDVHLEDAPAVQDGIIVANLWKLTGINTFGTPYSARDMAMVNYAAPHLTLDKSVTPPSPLVGGSQVPYRIDVENTGGGVADQVNVVDTLPVGQRATAPVIDGVTLNGTGLSAGSDYVSGWNGATGELTVDLLSGGAHTPVPGGAQLRIDYTATLDNGVAANSSLTNTATVGYSTRATADGRVTPGTSNPADDNTDISTIHPDGLTIAKSGPAGPFTIGEVFGYDLDITVPAHEIAYWPSIADRLSREGFVATGTPTITTLSGSPVTAASFASTATAPVRTVPVSGQALFTFDLSDPIDNSASNQPYVFRVHFDVQYTAIRGATTWEMQPPATNDSVTDTATVAWNSVASAVRTTDSSAVSGSVTTSLQQPLLRTVKSVTSPGPYVGGSTIEYQLVITNSGTSRAFDPSIADVLPVAAVDATITSLSLTGSSISTANVTSWVATPTMRVGFDPTVSIGTTQTLTVRYRVTLSSSLGAGVTLTNTADVNWNSLAGAPGGSRVYNDGSQENWTLDRSTQTRNASTVTIAKRGPAGPIRIGDIVTYSIDTTVPANTVAWYPSFRDTMTQRGVSYVSGSATITTRANPPATPATLGGASTPVVTTSLPSNTIFTWNLPDAINNSGNPLPYGLTLSFDVRVTGLNGSAWEYWPATGAQSVSDSASFRWRDIATGGPATNRTVNSGSVATAVRQPLISTTKTILTPGPLVGGSAIDYQVVLSNSSGFNTAYDISVIDVLPAEVATASLTSASLSGVGSIMSSATVDFSGLPASSVTFDSSVSLSTTQTITLVYHCQLAPGVGAGATLTNQANANWSSMPGVVTGERVYNDASQEAAWTADTSSVATVTPLATLTKAIGSGLTTATIGSIVTYTLETTVPANTTAYQLAFTDTVPDSLEVLAAWPSAGLPAAVVGVPGPAGTPVSIGPADWPMAPTASPATATVTLLCQVRDLRYSGPAVANGPVANSGGITWKTMGSGGTTQTASAGPVSFDVVQPNLTVTKNATPASAGPGDIATFTSVMTNTGNSTAYLPSWTDTLPSTMNSPALLSVKHSALPTLSAGTDFSTSVVGNTLAVALDQAGSPSIAPGESVTVRWTGTVNGGVHNATSMVDTATIASYSSLPTTTPPARAYGPTSATAAVTALSPALVITKSMASDPYPLQGTTAHYVVAIRNVGTAPALAVVATDTLPADLTYVLGTTSALWPSAGASSTADPTGGTGPTLHWDFGGGAMLNAGETLTLTFDAEISASAPLGSRINTITTAATDAGGSPVPANAAAWIPADTNPTDSATVPIRIVKPGVAITKVIATGGDTHVQVGQRTGFRLTVTNTGDTTLNTVPLTDTYDNAELQYFSASQAPSSAGGGTVRWDSFGTIAPGASRSVNVTFTVLAQPASGVTTNYAGVAGVVDEFGHPVESIQDTATVAVTNPALSLVKTLHAGQDTTIQAGQTVTYDMTVTNTGDTTLTTVPLTDTYVAADLAFASASVAPDSVAGGVATWTSLGALAPGASTTVVATFTALSAPAGNTSTDTARVIGAIDEHGDSPSNANASAHVAITAPSVAVAKTLVGDGEIQVGQTATFRLDVTNTGDTWLTSVALADAWDSAALGSPTAAPAGTYGAGSANWTLASPLAPGASTVVTLTLTSLAVPSGQITTDTATVSGTDANGDPAPGGSSSASVRVTHPSVAISKALHAGQDPQIQVGQPVAFDMTITNTGDTTLTTVPLADAYDSTALAYSTASIAPSSAVGGIVTWGNTGTLAPGASRTVVATFTATAVPVGQVSSDTATVAFATDIYGDHPADTNASSSIRITAPNVSVVKTRALGQDTEIQPGQTAVFDLAVTNTGDTALTTVPLTDTWDAATLAFVGATAVPGSTGSGTASWTLGPLAPSATTTVTITLVALASPGSLTSTDTATATGTDVYGDPAGPSSSSAAVMVTEPSVAVLKSLSASQDPQVQAGQNVSFDLRVTNTGNTPLATVPLTDAFDASALTYTTATVAPTSAGAGALSWSDVGPLAIGATRVVTVTFVAAAVPTGQVTVNSLACTGTVDAYGDHVADAASSASVRITNPAVAVTKSLHAGQDTAVQAGQPVVFDIVVTNTGDTTLTTVPLTDTFDDASLAFTGASPAADTSGLGSAHWNDLGVLAPGASASVTATFSAVSNPPGQVTTDTATVPNATDMYGDHPADPNASASVKVTHPALSVSKTLAPAQDLFIQTGQTVTFNLAVTNTGDTTLTAVPLSDGWDATCLQYVSASVAPDTGAPGLATWTLGPIAPGATSAVDLTLIALGPVPSHVTTDLAVVSGATDENGDPANDDASAAAISITEPALAITKQLHAGQDSAIQVGQTVTYDIGITNTGDTTLTVVPLADEFDPAVFSPTSASPAYDSAGANTVSWNNVGPLPAGGTTTVTATFTAVATSNGAASVDTATVAGATDLNGDPYATVRATAGELVTRPEVAITKTLAPGQPATVRLGSVVGYDITVTNTGDSVLTTVPLGDLFDAASCEYVSAVRAPSVIDTAGLLLWDNVISTPLAPGASVTTRVNLRTIAAINEAVNLTAVLPGATDVNGDLTPPVLGFDQSLSVYDPATLEVTKTADPTAGTILLPNQLINYTIGWTNQGGVEMPGVAASDPLPDSVIYVPGSLKLNGTALTDAADIDAGTYDGVSRTVRASLGNVSAGATGTLTFQVRVAAESLSAKGVYNRAYFEGQGASVATAGPVYHPVDPITIVKVGKDVNGGKLRGGDAIEWTITVTNIGLSPTTHVVISDTVPNTTTYVKRSIRGRGANDSKQPNLKWDIGTMAVGEKQVVTFRSTVKKGLATGTRIRNQATVASDQSRPKRSDNPKTSTAGDPTIMTMKTSGSEGWRIPLAAGILMFVAAMWLWPRRRRLAVEPQRSSDRKAGGRDA
jgi:uncharacterized repeat protein (TIGR01451 family)/fimbrial isopeptide formation D2 family protein